MAIQHLNSFLQHYFTAHDCQITNNHDGILTIQLTEEMDRALMNRPFYWHYIKKIGKSGDPMQLKLITNPDKRDEKGEWIHFGSPRVHQIFGHLQSNERFTRLFQQMHTNQKTALQPWLVINMKISYFGRQKKDEMISIGLNLINGIMKYEMMNQLGEIPLQITISDYCFTLSPIITLNSGFKRIEARIKEHIQAQPNDWADEATKTLQAEINLLKHFYTDVTDEEQLRQMEKEIKEITSRYQPVIHCEVVNGGIFHLTNQAVM